LRCGRADVAIIPAIEYQRIPGLAILPDMAIASRNQVRSLLLVSRKPIEQVQTLALDSNSRSTQVLTRILCAEKWRITPQFSQALPDLPEMLHESEAALIIGDPALRISLAIEKEGWPGSPGQTVCQAAALGVTSAELLYVYDVVGEWRALTGLPAVLAVWACRRELATPELTADFLASRDFGLAHLGEISYEAAQDLELPQRALESYLRNNIDFSLDAENRRGLELYFEHAAKLGLIREAAAIQWVASIGGSKAVGAFSKPL
jgi:chorismate dehydratase